VYSKAIAPWQNINQTRCKQIKKTGIPPFSGFQPVDQESIGSHHYRAKPNDKTDIENETDKEKDHQQVVQPVQYFALLNSFLYKEESNIYLYAPNMPIPTRSPFDSKHPSTLHEVIWLPREQLNRIDIICYF
jgi:hypothetical protein